MTHTKKIILDAHNEYSKKLNHWRLLRKIEKDLEDLENQGLYIKYYFMVDESMITFTIISPMKDWDAIENFVAELSIKNNIPFIRHISSNYENGRPEAYYVTPKPIVLPKSKISILININCSQHIPPECKVNVESRRTWINKTRYSYSCSMR